MANAEPDITGALVCDLIAEQHPQFSDLPILPVASGGTDNALFRLGEEMVVRLPRVAHAAPQIAKELRWLPHFASLPLAVPAPVAEGAPNDAYPWNWSINRWITGENLSHQNIGDPDHMGTALAGFVAALQQIASKDGPPSGEQNQFRGAPLTVRDDLTRKAILTLDDELNAKTLEHVWQSALDAPVHSGDPVWLHGDLHPENLLATNGKLSAVLDFGLIGVGDPACDLMAAWTALTPKSRSFFHDALQVDDAAWSRGRGWALSTALIALAYYRESNAPIVELSRNTIRAVLADRMP